MRMDAVSNIIYSQATLNWNSKLFCALAYQNRFAWGAYRDCGRQSAGGQKRLAA